MHRAHEKQLTARAVELGNAGDGAALPELIGLLVQESAQVRRLAASVPAHAQPCRWYRQRGHSWRSPGLRASTAWRARS